MTPPTKSPVFLERASYRQRRVRDAARLVPALGIILWVIPLSWTHATPDAPTSTYAIIYIFGVWVVLIVLTAFLSRLLRVDEPERAEDDAG